jgi:hypothetical protein
MSSTAIDIKIQDVGGLSSLSVIQYPVQASATLIYPGEIVKQTTVPYVIKLADGDPVISTTLAVVGLAKSTSTNTASADGTVDVFDVQPGTVLRGVAKSSTAANTAAKITALIGKFTVIDVTSSLFTVDTANAGANTAGFVIVGGNPDNNEVYFKIRPSALNGLIA